MLFDIIFFYTTMIQEVIFDVETQKFFDEIDTDNPGDLGVSLVSVYKRKLDNSLNEIEGKMISFWENEFDKMWPIFQEANRIIGFNSIHFDVPALQPYTNLPLNKLPHFDILRVVKDVFGRRIGLDAIARETLGAQKNDQAKNAIVYWRKHDKKSLSKLKKYCEMDVTLTKDLYDYGLKNGKLQFKDKWNTLRTIQVDFSHPEEIFTDTKQAGLF